MFKDRYIKVAGGIKHCEFHFDILYTRASTDWYCALPKPEEVTVVDGNLEGLEEIAKFTAGRLSQFRRLATGWGSEVENPKRSI